MILIVNIILQFSDGKNGKAQWTFDTFKVLI